MAEAGMNNGATAEEEDAPLKRPAEDRSREGKSRDKDRRERERSRERDRSRERHKDRKERKERKDRDRSRSRSRRRHRSRSRDRQHRRSRTKSRSRSRDRRRRRSRSKDRRHRSRSRSRSEDGVGGYRPRKRQEPAKPTASMFATNDPFAHLRSKAPVDPAEAMRVWQEQMLKSRQLVLAQQAKSAVQQANKAQRELYIGNLTPGAVTDHMLRQVFDSALIAAFPAAATPGLEPVVKVSIHSDGRYGFVEFRSPEYASAALELNGQINLLGQALSIGRPASYVDPNKVNLAAQQAEAALAAFKQGVPVGQLAGGGADVAAPVALVPGSQGANMAAAGNLVAAGHNVAAGVPAVAAAAAAAGALPAAAAGGLAGLIAENGASSVPTPFLCVTGMVTAAVLADKEEYDEVLLDLQEECEKHGKVYEVKIPRPADPATSQQVFGSNNYGKAFVQFYEVPAAQAAKEAMHGRIFAGIQVHATFITAQAYAVAVTAMDSEL